MSEIKKKCPFCGGETENESNSDFIFCSNKECLLNGCGCYADEWNNRPEEDRLREIIRKKDEALKFYAGSTCGTKNENGTYSIKTKDSLGFDLEFTYDPRLAQEALKIGEK